jgi:hypothetical protein
MTMILCGQTACIHVHTFAYTHMHIHVYNYAYTHMHVTFKLAATFNLPDYLPAGLPLKHLMFTFCPIFYYYPTIIQGMTEVPV